MKGAITAVTLALVVAAPASGQAQDRAPSPGHKLLQQGLALHLKGDFQRAIKVLRRAAAVARAPALLARIQGQLGVNYHVVNRKQQARAALLKALRLDPTFALDERKVGRATAQLLREARATLQGWLRVELPRPNARAYLDQDQAPLRSLRIQLPIGRHQLRLETPDGLWACAAQVVVHADKAAAGRCTLVKQTGKLSLVSVPEGAQVSLGARVLGLTPLQDVVVEVGQHQLRLRLAGYQQQTLTVQVGRGASRAYAVKLDRVTSAAVPTSQPTTVHPTDSDAVTPAAPQPGRRLWTWVAGGAALAAAVTGAILAGVVQSQVDEWDEISDPKDARLDELEASIPRNAIARNVMLGTAGALAITAVVLFFVEGRPAAQEQRQQTAASSPMLMPAVGSAPGLLLRVRF